MYTDVAKNCEVWHIYSTESINTGEVTTSLGKRLNYNEDGAFFYCHLQ